MSPKAFAPELLPTIAVAPALTLMETLPDTAPMVAVPLSTPTVPDVPVTDVIASVVPALPSSDNSAEFDSVTVFRLIELLPIPYKKPPLMLVAPVTVKDPLTSMVCSGKVAFSLTSARDATV